MDNIAIGDKNSRAYQELAKTDPQHQDIELISRYKAQNVATPNKIARHVPLMDTFETLRVVLEETLQIGNRAQSLVAETPLLGHLPELDSMAVVEVVARMELEFSITVYDDDINADVFKSFGSLAAFIDEKRRG